MAAFQENMTRIILAATDICSLSHEHASHSRICVHLEALTRRLLSLTSVIQTVGAKYPSQELEVIIGDLGWQLENAKHVVHGIGIYPQVYRMLSAVRIRAQCLQACRAIGLSLEGVNMLLMQLDNANDEFPSQYLDDLMTLATSFLHMEYPLQKLDVRLSQKTKNWALQFGNRQISQRDALNLINEYLEQTIGVEKLKEDWGHVSMLFLHDIHSARCRGDETEEHYLRLIFWAINGVNSPPPEFLCPITLQLLHDPVILTETEVTYEKRNIINWMVEDESKTCPVSQKKIKEVNLVENRALKAVIEDWCRGEEAEKNGFHRSTLNDQQKLDVYQTFKTSEISDSIDESEYEISKDSTPSSLMDSWDDNIINSLLMDPMHLFASNMSGVTKTTPSQKTPKRDFSFRSGSSGSSSQTSRIQMTLMSKEIQSQVFQASETGDVLLLEDLSQEKGFNFNLEDESGRNPLHIASIYGQAQIVEFLISKGLSPRSPTKSDSSSPLILAATYGHPSCIDVLLNRGADLVTQDKRGWTALHAACDQGRFEVVKILVEFGIRHNLRFLDIKTETGWTALHSAARCGDLEVFMYLMSGHCNINEECKAGWTPLHVAVEMGHRSIVDIILQNPDTKVNLTSKEGWTALHTAVDQNDLDIGRLLIQAGIDVNASSNDGITALHRAAYSNKMSYGKMLVEEGQADLGIKTKNGRKAIHIAAENGNNEFYNYLHWKGLKGLIKRKKKLSR
eukprot:g7060.t1